MRFVHIADLHIGKIVSGYSLLDDQRFALERVLSICKERNASALVLAGDIYDKTVPSAEAVSLVDWFITEASNEGLTILAVPGNHDSAERIAYASELLASHGVHFPAIYEGELNRVHLADEHGPITFWLMPFLKPAHVRPHFPDEEIDQDYTSAIRAALSNCQINTSQRNVLVAHQFVTAGSATPEVTDSELSLGGIDNVDVSAFDAFDYVALGHVHRPQRIGRDEVRYAGSLLKYSFSEINYPKSACVVDLGAKGDVMYELVPISPMRDMREIKGPLEAILAPEVLEQSNKQDFVHVILTDEEPAINALARVRSAYPNVMTIEYDNARTRHVSSVSPHAEALQELDPFQLFEKFYEEQNGTSLNEEQTKLVRSAVEEACSTVKGVAL